MLIGSKPEPKHMANTFIISINLYRLSLLVWCSGMDGVCYLYQLETMRAGCREISLYITHGHIPVILDASLLEDKHITPRGIY